MHGIFWLIISLGLIAVIRCSPSSEPDWETRVQDLFESKKKAIAKQHASKLRLKSGELYLPTNVVPKSYRIKIRPILESSDPNELFTAPGSVTIAFECTSPTNSITLHAQTKEFMKIIEQSVRLEVRSGNVTENKAIAIFEHWYDEENTDFYKIHLSSTLTKGTEYAVYIEFVTKIATNTLSGLYLSNYTDPEANEIKHVAVTQFEDISARKMFPCMDEPHLKAIFEIIISRSEKYNSMSNMPQVNTSPDPERDGYFLDFYSVTPQMSTYLVAIVVSEFTCTKAPVGYFEKPVEACGPEHMIAKGGGIHAAKISAKILHFYNELWQRPYPLPKMQSVAIPDFEAGAMENYGLNTYRIKALIYYPGVTTEGERFGLESTIAHELAHQNFGNLVTCKTWNQIFLNEGFATYVSYLGAQAVSPEFEWDSGWYTGYFQKALKRDAEPNVHPVVKKDEYFGDFDSITYSKGASLIKMMEHILSWDTFYPGMKLYLRTFAFSNTEYGNLFETLNKQAEINQTQPGLASMTEIMEPWTIQPGFPLIRVQRVFQKMFYVSQERFRKSPVQDKVENEAIPSLWYCPIFVATSADLETTEPRRPEFWLTNKEVTKSWTTKASVDWIIVNVNSAAYIRVLYDEPLTLAIQNQLDKNATVFSPITRASLIDDAFECGWARYNPIDVALSRTKYLAEESEPAVWSTAVGHFAKIYQMLSEDPASYYNFKNYLGPRVSGALRLIGVEQLPEEKGRSVLHRGSLLLWASLTKSQIVIDYAKKLIAEWKTSPDFNPVPVDIRDVMYCAAAINSTEEDLNFILQQYITETDEEHKLLLVQALGCSSDSKVLERLLETAVNPASGIRRDHGYILLQKIAGNPVGRMATYYYIRENFDDLLKYFVSPRVIPAIVSTFSRYWNTERHLELVGEFVNEHSDKLGPVMHTINSSIAKIKENIDWMGAYGESIKLWLAEQPENSS